MFKWRLLFLSLTATVIIAASIDTGSVQDRFRWLEEDSNPQTVEWLANQNQLSDSYFADAPNQVLLTEQLLNIMHMDIVFSPQSCQDLTFFLARFKDKQQAALYVINSDNDVKSVIDPEEWSPDGTASLSDYVIQKNGSLVAYGIKENGSDQEIWAFKNFRSGEEIPDRITKIKFCPPIWSPDNKGLFYFGYIDTTHQALYYHCLGTPEEEDKLLYSYPMEGAVSFGLCICNESQMKFNVRKGTSTSNAILLTNLADLHSPHTTLTFTELFKVGDASYNYVGDYEGRLYFVTNKNASRRRIISVNPAVLSEEPKEELSESYGIIQEACFVKDRLVVNYLTNGCSELKIFDPQRKVKSITLPGKGTVTLSKVPLNDEIEFFFSYTDFIHPSSLYKCNSVTGEVTPFMTPQINWNPEDYEVHQLSYPSTDGVHVPLFVVHKKGLPLDGSSRTLLYAYGGFNISLSPAFSASTLAWLENDGVYAMANIRGGGELGEDWHKAGMLENKQQCFDDFMAAAKFLCAKGYTNESKLAVIGGSNGGLLVGACLIQNPGLFKAAIANVGVFDMLRFHLFTIGWAWTAEYGSPDNPEDFANLRKYSPYHCVESGKAYPSTLITTSDHDDRVVPLHSYKFAAALQEAQEGPNPIVLRVYSNTGHGAGKSQRQIITEVVERLIFLYKELE